MKIKRKLTTVLAALLCVGALTFNGNKRTVTAQSSGDSVKKVAQKVSVSDFYADGKTTTEELILVLKDDIENFETAELRIKEANIAEITSIRKSEKANTYILKVNAKAEGKVSLEAIFTIGEERNPYYLMDKEGITAYQGKSEISFGRTEINVTNIRFEKRSVSSNNDKIILELEKNLPYSELKTDFFPFDDSIFLISGMDKDETTAKHIVIKGLPKKTAFLDFPTVLRGKEEKYKVTLCFSGGNNKVKVRREDSVSDVQKRIRVKEIRPEGAYKTEKIVLTLSEGIADLRPENLIIHDADAVLRVTGVTAKNTENTMYEIAVETKKAGKVYLDEIIQNRSDIVFEFTGKEEKKEIQIKKEKRPITISLETVDATGGEYTEYIKIGMNPFIEGLTKGDFSLMADASKVDFLDLVPNSAGGFYRMNIRVKKVIKSTDTASVSVGLKDSNGDYQVTQQENSVKVKRDASNVVVRSLTAEAGATTPNLILIFDKAVPGLTKAALKVAPENIAEVLAPISMDGDRSYKIPVKVKKAGKIKLTEIQLEGFTFTGLENDGKEVTVKLYIPEEEEEEELRKEEKKKKEEEKKEETKKEETKKEEKNKEAEKEFEEIVITPKRRKSLSVTVKEEVLKAALEKELDLVVQNKKQKLEIGVETLKNIYDEGGKFKVTLKPVKEKALTVKGAKHTRAYDFKINNKTMKTAEPVKVTLNYKGAKLPKVYVVGKNGKLTEVKGVKLDKATKTVSFNTKHIKKFVLAY